MALARTKNLKSGSRAAANRRRAEKLAAPLPPLMVEAERVASTVAQGIHGRRRIGVGESFWQYRHHRPEDPASAIDWRQSAKTDHLYVRENEWEAAESVWLWRDASHSMHYASDETLPTKYDRATLLTLAVSILLLRGGERVALLGRSAAPAAGRLVIRRLAVDLAQDEAAPSSLPPQDLLPRFAQSVLISDFLCPLEPLETTLSNFAERGVRGHLLQILDPAEEELPFEGRTKFEGVEEPSQLTVGRAEALRAPYKQRLAAHRAALQRMAQALGWTFSTHRTDHKAGLALLALYGALSGDALSQMSAPGRARANPSC